MILYILWWVCSNVYKFIENTIGKSRIANKHINVFVFEKKKDCKVIKPNNIKNNLQLVVKIIFFW